MRSAVLLVWRLVRVYYARVLLARRRLLRGISSAGSVGPPAAAAVPAAFPQLARDLLQVLLSVRAFLMALYLAF